MRLLQNDRGEVAGAVGSFTDVTSLVLANEKIALGTDTVKNAMSAQHIRYMKADWTNRNPEVSRLLARYQRSGVPLYVFFPGSGKPAVVLPQLLSKEKVLTAFKAAQGS